MVFSWVNVFFVNLLKILKIVQSYPHYICRSTHIGNYILNPTSLFKMLEWHFCFNMMIEYTCLFLPFLKSHRMTVKELKKKKKRHRLTKIKRMGEEIIGVYKKTLLEIVIY